MYNFSPSSLSLLKDCPRCFWMHFNKAIKRPNGIFPSLPSGMDRILKEHFDRFMKKGVLPPELKDLKGYELFNDEELLKIWRSNFKGIQYKEDEFTIRGAIDNLLTKNKKLVVLDYKTRGFPLKEDTHEHYIDQMTLYNYLLRKNNYKTEDYAYLLFYHPDKVQENGSINFHAELIKIKLDVNNAEKILKNAIKVLKDDIPDSKKECEFCKWINNN